MCLAPSLVRKNMRLNRGMHIYLQLATGIAATTHWSINIALMILRHYKLMLKTAASAFQLF